MGSDNELMVDYHMMHFGSQLPDTSVPLEGTPAPSPTHNTSAGDPCTNGTAATTTRVHLTVTGRGGLLGCRSRRRRAAVPQH
jgi:hypothetical protein